VKNTFQSLWLDTDAFIVSSELIIVGTILVIGLLVGMTSVRDQVVQEVRDVAAAMSKTVQSYSFAAITGHTASTGGSVFGDMGDFCDQIAVAACDPDLCISVEVGATIETGE
jgi:hypothetical protein